MDRQAGKSRASAQPKHKIITFRWRQEHRYYECIRLINTIEGALLSDPDYPSETGDKKFSYELVAACTSMREQLRQENPRFLGWRVRGRFLDNQQTPYPSHIDTEEKDVVVFFEGTTSACKVRFRKWRMDAQAENVVDYRARVLKFSAQYPSLGRAMEDVGDAGSSSTNVCSLESLRMAGSQERTREDSGSPNALPEANGVNEGPERAANQAVIVRDESRSNARLTDDDLWEAGDKLRRSTPRSKQVRFEEDEHRRMASNGLEGTR